MLTKTAIAAALLTVTAFSASASNQLALSLGVEPGVYTTAELIQLNKAVEDNNLTQIGYITSHAGSASVSAASSSVTTASDQLALSTGALPGEYTTADLINLRLAQENNDLTTAHYISNGSPAFDVPATDQLALSLGQEPGTHTLAELAIIRYANDAD